MEDHGGVVLGEPINLSSAFGQLQVRHISGGETEGVILESSRPLPSVIPVRLQSSCLFSESFAATDCDCAAQLNAAIGIICEEGGLVIYLYEEGRGAGLKSKIDAIRLQQTHGCDTAAAFRELALPEDLRNYELAAHVLTEVLPSGAEIELLTNNPSKEKALQNAQINVVRRRSLVCEPSNEVREYLREKARVLGHEIETSNE